MKEEQETSDSSFNFALSNLTNENEHLKSSIEELKDQYNKIKQSLALEQEYGENIK